MTLAIVSHLDDQGQPTEAVVGPFHDELEATAWGERPEIADAPFTSVSIHFVVDPDEFLS